jgi:hypothetical protein
MRPFGVQAPQVPVSGLLRHTQYDLQGRLNVDSRHSIARDERVQSAPALWSLYRLALVCGIMIPHRCLSNADNISGRFDRGQRLEVACERRHNGGCDVGSRYLRAGRRCAPTRSPPRAPQVSERRLMVPVPVPHLRPARAQAQAARKGHVLAMLCSKRAWVSHIGRLGRRARRGAGHAD